MEHEMQVVPQSLLDQNSFGNNPLMWLITLGFLGRSNLLGGGNAVDGQLDLTEIKSALQNLGNGLCAIQYENAKTFADLSAQVSSCCCNIQNSIVESKYETGRNIDQLRFDMTQQMSQLRFDGEKQTCEIIRNDDRNTQTIIDKLNSDKICSLETQLLEAKSAYNNQLQTQVLLDAMSKK